MKKMRILVFLMMVSIITAQWKDLTLEDAIKESPFKTASLGQWKWISESDEYLFMDTTMAVKPLHKYNLATGDTSLFLSEKKLVYDGKNIEIVDYTYHPKSKKLLLVTNQRRIWRYSRIASYYLYDMTDGLVIQVAGGNDLRNVKFSPDGNSIAYLKSDNNLYAYNININKEEKLTKDGSFEVINGHFGWVYEEEFGSYDSYRWSPDSKYIAFVREDQTYVKRFPMMDELHIYPKVYWHHYPKVGETNPVLNIGIANVNNGRTKWLDLNSSEEMYYPRIKWIETYQTDSRNQELVVTRINRHQNRLELLRFDVKKGTGEVFWKDESKAWINLTDDLFFLKDGSFVTLSEHSGFQHIYHFNENGELINQVTKGEWEVSGIAAFDEENGKVYLNGKKDSVLESNLYSVNLDGSGFKRLSDKLGWHTVQFSPTKKYYIDSYSTANSPLEITLHNFDGSKVRDISITDVQQFNEYGFSETKFFQIKTSDDGTLLNAMMTLPRDFNPDIKYPVIVFGYSGPGSQVVVNKPASYNLWDKYMNQNGYITFSIDPRGTGGRGTDFKYLSYKDIGKWVVIDQVEGAKFLKSLEYVDGDRIGIWGWSEGGSMTVLCMTAGAPNFKVGVAGAGNYDHILYDTIWTERYMGLLDENIEGYINASAISYAHLLQGKLLVIHGTMDDNVHLQHSTQLMEAFVRANKHADFITYANQPHGLIRYGSGRFHLWTKITNYFMENL
ncbi:S9 family peptidase [Candidatus Neomarinimicrobiota bacterium]